MTDEKKLSLSGRPSLGVGKGVETGKVRQSFSHGRTKPVVVEVKRKRVLKKGGAPAPAEQEAKKPETEAFKPKRPASDDRAGTLSAAEREVRERALTEARKREEEEAARRAEEEARRKQEEEEARRKAAEEEALRQAKAEAEGTTVEDMEAEAKRNAEAAAKRAAEDKQRKKEEAEARKAAEEAARLQAAEESRQREEKAREKPAAKAAPKRKEDEDDSQRGKPSRGRGDERRRAGKLSVNRAFEDGDGRQRSLAAWKRAQAKRQRGGGGSQPQQRQSREVIIPDVITVQELANRMAEKSPAVIKTLMKLGVMATINENLDPDTAELVVAEFGHTVKRVSESDVEIGIVGEEDNPTDLQPRAPIVTVMGHVDHGKTSLLDALRQSDVVSGEAGGITQHIGAYQVQLGGGDKITFLDTPGHEAFTQMRSRGAAVTDLVILVVAADDGIMPQTVEALNHAKAAAVPIIVAINKIDKPGADANRVRTELLQHDIQVESMGGDVLDVEVSALKRTNLDKLQEAILLQAELMELKANPDRTAEGVVIEAKLDKGRGPVATVLIRRGTLRVGDIFVAGAEWGRVRALIDDRGNRVESAGPAEPVEVLGLNAAPSAGDEFAVVDNEARAREISTYRQGQQKKRVAGAVPTTLEGMFASMRERQADSYPIVLKADVQGSAEAIVQALEKIGNEDIRARLLHAAVGGITETDISLAAASDALVIGFNVRANKQAKEAAARDGVGISYYSVIYDLVDDVKSAMEGRLDPEIRENTLGLVDVLDVFSAGKAGKAAGCLVTEGIARKGAKVRVLRDDVVVYTGAIASLRRFKDDVNEVKSGMECGMTFENFVDVRKGDQIEMFEEEKVKRSL